MISYGQSRNVSQRGRDAARAATPPPLPVFGAAGMVWILWAAPVCRKRNER
jgi:hypothetical protein